MENLHPSDRVKQSTRRVVEKARFIRLNPTRLAEFAAQLDPAQIRQRYTYEDDFHLLASSRNPLQQLNYIFTLDALNFGSGFSPAWKALTPRPRSLYITIAEGLKQYVESGGVLDPQFAANITPAALSEIFQVPPGFELFDMFAASLNQLGRWVMDNYENNYVNLIEELGEDNRAGKLVELLTRNLSYFDDTALYDGEPVYFYKRTQILANDLYLAFGGKGWGNFPDVNRLTMFADNLVPHVFRIEGVLEFDPALAAQIDRGEPLEAGSPAEIEIRAFGIICVEELCKLLGSGLFPAQVDVFLWNLGQGSRYKSSLRHLTRTYFY